MDVANINKGYSDPVAGGKGSSSGDQLMVDFSAAVAARMSSVGGKAAEQGKNALTGQLTAKTHVAAAKEDQAPPPREDITDAMPARRADEHADKAPVDASHDDHADDYSAPATAPRDSASHGDRDNTAHADTSRNDTNTAGDAPHDGDGRDAQNASGEAASGTQGEAQTATAADAAVDHSLTAAVLPVDTGKADQVLSTVAAKAETAVTATGEGAPKQNALNGLNTAQDAAAKNNATPNEVQNGDEQLADVSAKGKRGSQQAAATPQAAQNAAQTKGEGATTAQQQAADLSRAVGQEHRLNVNVNVTKQANELTSQPSQNLTAQVVQSTEGDTAATNAAQAAGKGQGMKLTPTQNAGQNAGQNGADGQAQGQTQNQGQAQAQGLMQAQIQATQGDAAKAATGGEAKSVSVQAANAATSTQTVKAGGAEVATPTPSATPTTASAQTHQAAAPAKPQAAPQTPARTPVTDQVTVQISKAIADGMDSIRIQLKPAHLGRVDVNLEMGQDGRVSAVITADNKDTLDLLKQDSRELQKALRDAGLQMDSSDLSFNLRGEGGKANGGQETAQNNSSKSAAPLPEPSLEELLQAQPGHRNIITKDRVDITA